MPKVSTIVPTYNYAHFLRDCVNSIIQQTYKDFEIVVIDDGSTDETRAIVESLIESNPGVQIRYIYQNNQGPAAARNHGIREAQGEYIAFCDADDVWAPEKLDKQLDLFEQDPELAMIFSDMSQQVEDGCYEESYFHKRGINPEKFTNVYSKLIERNNFIIPTTVVLRRKILDDVGIFDERYRVGEDYELWLRIAKKYKIGYIDKPLVIRFSHEGSISRTKDVYCRDNIRITKELLSRYEFSKKERFILRQRIKQNNYELGYHYFAAGEYKRSVPYFWRSFGRAHGFKALFYVLTGVFPAKLINLLRSLKGKNVALGSRGQIHD